MRKIFKGGLILCILTMALALMPVPQATAEDTETFVNKSPHFTLTVPMWIKSSKSLNPATVLRKAMDPMEVTSFDVAVVDLAEGTSYKTLAKGAIAFFEDNYNATNCEILYEREIKLKDGTPAYEQEVKWQHPAILLYTYQLSVIKDKKLITVAVTDQFNIKDKYKEIPMSLTFK